MATLDSLPTELLINIINLAFNDKRPLSTGLLLLNKNLCHIMMLEQVNRPSLKKVNITTWLDIIEVKHEMQQSSITRYNQLLDQIRDLELDDWGTSVCSRLINFVRRCTNLRKIVLWFVPEIDQFFQAGVLPSNMTSINIKVYGGNNTPKYLPGYLQKNTELRALDISCVYTINFIALFPKRSCN